MVNINNIMKENLSFCKICKHHVYLEEEGFNNRDYCSIRPVSFHTGTERLFVTRMGECKLINSFSNCDRYEPA